MFLSRVLHRTAATATLRAISLRGSSLAATAARTVHLRGKIPQANTAARAFTAATKPPKKEEVPLNKSKALGVALLVGVAALTTASFVYCANAHEPPSQNAVQGKVSQFIEHSKDFETLRKELHTTWMTLLQNGQIVISGTDKDVRPSFVALQGVVEQVLSSELGTEITSLRGIIHTPMPATPLCTKGEISKDLVDPTIAADPKRLFTVKARTTIVRDFVAKGADLFIAYPQGGLEKRTTEQQTVYKQELATNAKHLFDTVLNCSEIPEELIGATYIFTLKSGQEYAFAIKMTQAKDPKDQGHFGLWFGPLKNQAVHQRVTTVLNFLNSKGFNVDLFRR